MWSYSCLVLCASVKQKHLYILKIYISIYPFKTRFPIQSTLMYYYLIPVIHQKIMKLSSNVRERGSNFRAGGLLFCISLPEVNWYIHSRCRLFLCWLRASNNSVCRTDYPFYSFIQEPLFKRAETAAACFTGFSSFSKGPESCDPRQYVCNRKLIFKGECVCVGCVCGGRGGRDAVQSC